MYHQLHVTNKKKKHQWWLHLLCTIGGWPSSQSRLSASLSCYVCICGCIRYNSVQVGKVYWTNIRRYFSRKLCSFVCSISGLTRRRKNMLPWSWTPKSDLRVTTSQTWLSPTSTRTSTSTYSQGSLEACSCLDFYVLSCSLKWLWMPQWISITRCSIGCWEPQSDSLIQIQLVRI